MHSIVFEDEVLNGPLIVGGSARLEKRTVQRENNPPKLKRSITVLL